jgi:hypothetical protein
MNGRTRRTTQNKWAMGITKATKKKAARAERRVQKRKVLAAEGER